MIVDSHMPGYTFNVETVIKISSVIQCSLQYAYQGCKVLTSDQVNSNQC